MDLPPGAERDFYGAIGYLPLGNHAIRRIEFKPSPRIGIAYALNDKTVIRTGYGVFYGVPYAGATREFTSGAFTTSTPWVATVDGATGSPRRLRAS